MKCKTTVATILTIAVLGLAQENLIATAEALYPACDSYGSEIDTTGGLIQKDGSAKVAFTLTQKVSDAWPYVELICETGKPFTGTQLILVEYSADTTLVMKLFQTDFGPNGDESYALYEIKLPASKTLVTKTVAIKDFKQPEWAPKASRAIALNLDKCDRIYFTPDLSAEEENAKTTVVVKTLKLFGAKK